MRTILILFGPTRARDVAPFSLLRWPSLENYTLLRTLNGSSFPCSPSVSLDSNPSDLSTHGSSNIRARNVLLTSPQNFIISSTRSTILSTFPTHRSTYFMSVTIFVHSSTPHPVFSSTTSTQLFSL
ncbi:hypothetical protein M3Y96_00047500 [Aphelenchoides besseyi]|nr:hypothetical protein M3Y96_00047500 [Aphelenchoides besseyi]